MSLFLERLFRAARLDAKLYEEVVADAGTKTQALTIVFIYGMAAAYGSFGRTGASGINIAMITTLLGWYVWAFSTYMIGARLFAESGTVADRKSLVRALGFAGSPGFLRALGIVPGLELVAPLVASIWMIAAGAVAVKQALNYQSIYRALGVCLAGWTIGAITQALLLISLFSAFGVGK